MIRYPQHLGNVDEVYAPNGKKLDKLQKGVNILHMKDGKIKKVMVK